MASTNNSYVKYILKLSFTERIIQYDKKYTCLKQQGQVPGEPEQEDDSSSCIFDIVYPMVTLLVNHG